MISSKCLVCGSPNLRADRALSGRLVCNSCGLPYGVRKTGKNKLNSFNPFTINKKYILFICLFIFAFFLVII